MLQSAFSFLVAVKQNFKRESTLLLFFLPLSSGFYKCVKNEVKVFAM
jgi:hypothetical protein